MDSPIAIVSKGKRTIVLMRHCERLDRAMEKRDEDWISTAPRPQDPPLSEHGLFQAAIVGNQMKDLGIEKIYVSPLIRTVQTAHAIADILGLGPGSLHVEPGVIEEARSFRGKKVPEPAPTWNPLVLPLTDLWEYSDKINMEYTPLVTVTHVYDEELLNKVREVAEDGIPVNKVIVERSKKFLEELLKTDFEKVLVICHGATTKHCEALLQTGLDPELKIIGDRAVSCWAEFEPVDENNIDGPWYSPGGIWNQGASEPGETE
jgi:broad specificity phosphatase PhoE